MKLGLFEYSKAKPLAEAALNYRSLRQDLISSNISNVNTPFYRPKDVRFEDMLTKKAKEIFEGHKNKELKVAKTHEYHLENFPDEENLATIYYRDGHLARNDGNSVDLDIEMSEMSKNGVMYNALTEMLKKNGAIFKAALESSARLQ